MGRISIDFEQGSSLEQPAFVDDGDAGGDGGRAEEVVRGIDERLSAAAMHVPKLALQGLSQLQVERTQRLVQ